MGMISEFKEFINKGSVVDLAVAVVIGAAFKTVISAFVDGVIMPVIGVFAGGVDFTQLFISLDGNDYASLAAAQEAAAPVITYGAFIQTLIDFVIIAFVIFMVVKAYNRMNKPEEEAPAEPAEEVLLLREIRDSLKR